MDPISGTYRSRTRKSASYGPDTQHLRNEQEAFELELAKKENDKISNATIETQCNEIDCMDTAMHEIKPNVVPKTRNVRKHPCFKLIRKNADNEKFQYVTVRVQRNGVGRAMARIKTQYPQIQSCYGATI